MTIHELKALNEQSGGRFFSRENMKAAGDTMRDFSIREGSVANTVIVTRKRATKFPVKSWVFSTISGRIIVVPENKS